MLYVYRPVGQSIVCRHHRTHPLKIQTSQYDLDSLMTGVPRGRAAERVP